jgi:hypothetical protein
MRPGTASPQQVLSCRESHFPADERVVASVDAQRYVSVVTVLAGSSSQTHCRSRVTVRWN